MDFLLSKRGELSQMQDCPPQDRIAMAVFRPSFNDDHAEVGIQSLISCHQNLSHLILSSHRYPHCRNYFHWFSSLPSKGIISSIYTWDSLEVNEENQWTHIVDTIITISMVMVTIMSTMMMVIIMSTMMMVMKEMQYPQVHILYRSGVPWDCLKYLLFLQSSSLSSSRACGGPGNGENMTERGHLGTTSRPQVDHK